MTESAPEKARRELEELLHPSVWFRDHAEAITSAIARYGEACRQATLRDLANLDSLTVEQAVEGTELGKTLRAMIESHEAAARLAGIEEGLEKAALITEPTHEMPDTPPARAHYLALKTASKYIREERDRLRREAEGK